MDAVRMAKPETFLALLLWGAGIAAGLTGKATPFLLALFAWQGTVYATSLYMSWLNVRSKLPPELERRRRTERLRDRRGARLAFAFGAGALVAATVLATVLYLGGSNPGTPENPFAVPASSSTGPSGVTGTTGTGPTGVSTGSTGPTGPTATGPTATGPTATGPTATSSPQPTTATPTATTSPTASPIP